MKKQPRHFHLILLLAFATFGCDKPTSSVFSELQIRLAAQSPNQQHVGSVVVRFSEMAVRSSANSEYGTPGAVPHTIDLAELGGSETRILDVFSVAEGRYDAARLKLDGVTVTLTNGSQFSEVFSPPLERGDRRPGIYPRSRRTESKSRCGH